MEYFRLSREADGVRDGSVVYIKAVTPYGGSFLLHLQDCDVAEQLDEQLGALDVRCNAPPLMEAGLRILVRDDEVGFRRAVIERSRGGCVSATFLDDGEFQLEIPEEDICFYEAFDDAELREAPGAKPCLLGAFLPDAESPVDPRSLPEFLELNRKLRFRLSKIEGEDPEESPSIFDIVGLVEEETDTPLDTSSIRRMEVVKQPTKEGLQAVPLEREERILVISHCLTEITGQLTKYPQNEIQRLEMQILQAVFKGEVKFRKKWEIAENDLVAAPWDGLIARGIVTMVKTKTVQIYLIDYGREKNFNKKNVYSLPKDFMDRLPPQGIKIELDSILEEDCEDEEMEVLILDSVAFNSVRARVSGGGAFDSEESVVSEDGSRSEEVSGSWGEIDEESFRDYLEDNLEGAGDRSRDNSPDRILDPVPNVEVEQELSGDRDGVEEGEENVTLVVVTADGDGPPVENNPEQLEETGLTSEATGVTSGDPQVSHPIPIICVTEADAHYEVASVETEERSETPAGPELDISSGFSEGAASNADDEWNLESETLHYMFSGSDSESQPNEERLPEEGARKNGMNCDPISTTGESNWSDSDCRIETENPVTTETVQIENIGEMNRQPGEFPSESTSPGVELGRGEAAPETAALLSQDEVALADEIPDRGVESTHEMDSTSVVPEVSGIVTGSLPELELVDQAAAICMKDLGEDLVDSITGEVAEVESAGSFPEEVPSTHDQDDSPMKEATSEADSPELQDEANADRSHSEDPMTDDSLLEYAEGLMTGTFETSFDGADSAPENQSVELSPIVEAEPPPETESDLREPVSPVKATEQSESKIAMQYLRSYCLLKFKSNVCSKPAKQESLLESFRLFKLERRLLKITLLSIVDENKVLVSCDEVVRRVQESLAALTFTPEQMSEDLTPHADPDNRVLVRVQSGIFYRACVTSALNSDNSEISVYLIDHPNRMSVPHVFHCPEEIARIPRAILDVTLIRGHTTSQLVNSSGYNLLIDRIDGHNLFGIMLPLV